ARDPDVVAVEIDRAAKERAVDLHAQLPFPRPPGLREERSGASSHFVAASGTAQPHHARLPVLGAQMDQRPTLLARAPRDPPRTEAIPRRGSRATSTLLDRLHPADRGRDPVDGLVL